MPPNPSPSWVSYLVLSLSLSSSLLTVNLPSWVCHGSWGLLRGRLSSSSGQACESFDQLNPATGTVCDFWNDGGKVHIVPAGPTVLTLEVFSQETQPRRTHLPFCERPKPCTEPQEMHWWVGSIKPPSGSPAQTRDPRLLVSPVAHFFQPPAIWICSAEAMATTEQRWTVLAALPNFLTTADRNNKSNGCATAAHLFCSLKSHFSRIISIEWP